MGLGAAHLRFTKSGSMGKGIKGIRAILKGIKGIGILDCDSR